MPQTMSLRARFYTALLSSFVVIGLHVVATYLDLYWTIPNTDVLMHILGGVMAGLYAGVFLKGFELKESWRNMTLIVIMIGIGWEVLEYILKVDKLDFAYWTDTVTDIINDIIGGTIAYYIWRKI